MENHDITDAAVSTARTVEEESRRLLHLQSIHTSAAGVSTGVKALIAEVKANLRRLIGRGNSYQAPTYSVHVDHDAQVHLRKH